MSSSLIESPYLISHQLRKLGNLISSFVLRFYQQFLPSQTFKDLSLDVILFFSILKLNLEYLSHIKGELIIFISQRNYLLELERCRRVNWRWWKQRGDSGLPITSCSLKLTSNSVILSRSNLILLLILAWKVSYLNCGFSTFACLKWDHIFWSSIKSCYLIQLVLQKDLKYPKSHSTNTGHSLLVTSSSGTEMSLSTVTLTDLPYVAERDMPFVISLSFKNTPKHGWPPR